MRFIDEKWAQVSTDLIGLGEDEIALVKRAFYLGADTVMYGLATVGSNSVAATETLLRETRESCKEVLGPVVRRR